MSMSNGMGGSRGILLAMAIAAAPMVSACGGNNGAGTCGKVQPCGGDVVGSWTISGACANTASLAMQVVPNCPTAMATASNIQATGSASFNADMTYSLTQTLSVSASGTVPSSCLQVGGFTLTCAEFDLLAQQYVAMDPTTIQSVHCAGDQMCNCSFTLAPQTTMETGTWSTTGTTLLTTTSTASFATDYCVQKNQLHMMTLDTTMPMGAMGQATINTDTVFTKR